MRYRKPADINSERERLLTEMGDKNSEHYQLWLKDKKHPIVKANQTRLNDLDVAFFPSRRGKPACSPTPSFPEKNPSKVGYWLDYPRDRDELYRSAIIDTLAKSGASLPQVIELVADILVNNVGIVESAINNIQTHAKNKGKLLMPNGKYVGITDAYIQETLLPLSSSGQSVRLNPVGEPIGATSDSLQA